jgi:hypothetical protein
MVAKVRWDSEVERDSPQIIREYEWSCKMLRNISRYAIGLFYLVGGPLIHAYLMTQQRELYTAVDDTAWPLYQYLWSNIVLPNLYVLVPLLALLEMLAGVLMLLISTRTATIKPQITAVRRRQSVRVLSRPMTSYEF